MNELFSVNCLLFMRRIVKRHFLPVKSASLRRGKKRKRKTCRRSTAQLWNLYWTSHYGCVPSRFKRATVYHYVPIQNKNMYMYFLTCMYADAFVFIQGKIGASRPNCVWGKCFVVLEVLPHQNIFKNKTALQNYSPTCNNLNRRHINFLVAVFSLASWHKFTGMSAGAEAC